MKKKIQVLMHPRWVSPQPKARSTKCLTPSPPRLMPHPNTIGKTDQTNKTHPVRRHTRIREDTNASRKNYWKLKVNFRPIFQIVPLFQLRPIREKVQIWSEKSNLNFQYSALHLSKTCLGKRGKITYFPKDPFTLPPTFSAIPANHLLLSQAGLTLHTD